MLVATGYFENKTFIPDEPVSIPQGKRVVVTIEEDKTIKNDHSFKELAVKAKAIRSRIEADAGKIDVRAFIKLTM